MGMEMGNGMGMEMGPAYNFIQTTKLLNVANIPTLNIKNEVVPSGIEILVVTDLVEMVMVMVMVMVTVVLP